ncbi:unnamed protein product [Clavelina lepadiformis]|uniref:Peptidase metallopeptidase domain-containing protein n=1 Tax=Clavelina lepadiformis TaxID=159417 RepID=A0ABP0F132_CLALP
MNFCKRNLPYPASAIDKNMKIFHFAFASLCIILCLQGAESAAVSQTFAMSYLRQYGHLQLPDPMSGNLQTLESLTKAIKSFQRFAGIPMTGELDQLTTEKMSAKRCGNSDISGTDNAKRKRRYAIQGSRWPKKHLTYKISNFTPDLRRSDVTKEIAEAFKWWADESGLTFQEVSGGTKADIDIKFASGAHGDGDPFDGEGQTLAHAYFPTYGGDAHFDESEQWTLFTSSFRSGAKLRIVAAHEFGHSLGLSHSDVQQALMAPFYNPQSKGLHFDDIRAIQHLYGEPYVKPSGMPPSTRLTTTTRKPRTTTRRPTTTTLVPPVGACNGRFDAITRLTNGSTYAFLGQEFWRLNDQGADKGYPQKTASVWNIRGKIDAALSYNGYTDIFQGSRVYRFVGERRVRGYPLPISSVYFGIPSNIDAVFQWSGNGKIYFTKGAKYWRYNPQRRAADPGYPKSLSVWSGLPENIDASLQWNGKTYFFRDGLYYRFDDQRIQVAESNRYPYPRRADEWWLGCKDNTLIRKDGNEQTDDNQASVQSTNDNNDGGHGSGSQITLTKSSFLVITTMTMVVLNSIIA